MREAMKTGRQGCESPVHTPRRNPTADAAIGNIVREERRKRKEQWKKLMAQKCCQSCRHYCFWDRSGRENGCKNYGRPSYRQNPESGLCPEWEPCGRDGRLGP